MADYWRGDITLRKLRALVEYLPPESAWARLMRGHDWVSTNYQIADLHDELRGQIALMVARWTESHQFKEPAPVPRPGVLTPEDERRTKSTNNAIAYIEKYRAAREA